LSLERLGERPDQSGNGTGRDDWEANANPV
jgi:hypothetical protein